MTDPIDSADPDSRARTHLANERTFLAWFRTGLALIAVGLGAAQFLSGDLVPGLPLRRMLAGSLVAGGGLFVVAGWYRYRHGLRAIDRRDFAPAGLSVSLATLAAVVAMILALVFVGLARLG